MLGLEQFVEPAAKLNCPLAGFVVTAIALRLGCLAGIHQRALQGDFKGLGRYGQKAEQDDVP